MVVSVRRLLHDISRYIYNFFCCISKQLCIYSTISLWTPNGVLWNPKVPRNPEWETLHYWHRTCSPQVACLPRNWQVVKRSWSIPALTPVRYSHWPGLGFPSHMAWIFQVTYLYNLSKPNDYVSPGLIIPTWCLHSIYMFCSHVRANSDFCLVQN